MENLLPCIIFLQVKISMKPCDGIYFALEYVNLFRACKKTEEVVQMPKPTTPKNHETEMVTLGMAFMGFLMGAGALCGLVFLIGLLQVLSKILT